MGRIANYQAEFVIGKAITNHILILL